MQAQVGSCDGISGKILGRAGKVTGRNKDCYYVIFDNTGWTGWYALNTPKDLSLLPKRKESSMWMTYCTVGFRLLRIQSLLAYKKKKKKKKKEKKNLVGSSAVASFTYLGVDFKSYKDGITVDQIQYFSSNYQSPITMARQSNKDCCL
ncbi:unnamed protein product [Meganyctiphanes norvegica]|uniref:Uncharacterized protein n=1 Tax=Meganyctiphanes norvegica TaxID=48144 RepID=A0AAV2STG1_MEGNR